MFRRSVLRQTVILAVAIAAATQAHAQEVRAAMGGRVTDAQGSAVAKAALVVESEDTNVQYSTQTNNDGNWTVQFLLPGHYRFSVSAPGFKSSERRGIELQASDNKLIDSQLQVGDSSQTISVTAEVPLIDTTSATSGTVITEEELNEIPSLTHIPTLLATLSPGVVAQYQNNNVGHLWSYNAASQFTADGGRNNVYSNMYLLDGMPNIKAGGDEAFIPPTDTLSEFRVQTNAYDASIGRQAGATINMQSKSGRK
ncbi:MAG: carboxypeptidase-like regulatory domain-containing protein [Acidobacteriota bacterium]|nr:carboxypeptidase-like regulatory domain-containing protein [Acidobacteriota bacterium]